jgi:maltokinase
MATPDLTALDEERLGAWLLGRRWFGSKAEDVSQTHVLDVVTLDDGPPAVAIAAVEARFPTGIHAIYQLLLGMRADGESWSADRLDDLDGQTVYDAFADPEAAAVIPRLFAEDATIEGENATVDFQWAPSSPTAPSCSTTRSCSSSSAASRRARTPSSRCCGS